MIKDLAIKDFIKRLHIPKSKFIENKNVLFSALAVLIILIGVLWFINRPPTENAANEDLPFTIRAMGGLPSLEDAVRDNGALRDRVKTIIAYDDAFLFVNYKQINEEITNILFLWIGLKPAQVNKIGRQKSVELLLRQTYNFPKDEPIYNNPIIGDRPWANLFNMMKAKILMQGNAYKIYDGNSYYNSITDRMVIEGELSEGFLKGFADFVFTQPADARKGYINNYLVFIDETKGIKKLSVDERKLLKKYKFI